MSGPNPLVTDNDGRQYRFDQLYDLYFDDIFRYILHRIGRVADAQDVTAQTFFKALQHLRRFRWKQGSFRSWLYRIAGNEVMTFFRKHRPGRDLEDIQEPVAGHSADEELHRAEARLTRHKVFLALNHAIRQLGDEEQALIVFRFLEKKSFAEIAEIVNKKPGTVTMRVHRALKKLKTELESRGVGDERIREFFERHPAAGHRSPSIQTSIAP